VSDPKPRRAKSTGYRSTNSHFWAHVSDLFPQHNVKYSTCFDKEGYAKFLLLNMAEEDEWDGTIAYTRKGTPVFVPEPWSAASAPEANKAVDYCHVVADLEHFFVTEYGDDGVPVRTWFGKPKGET